MSYPAFPEIIELGDNLSVQVVRKRIKHVHLRVSPPDGRVTMSAPFRVNIRDIEKFAQERREWIFRTREQILTRAEEDKTRSALPPTPAQLAERQRFKRATPIIRRDGGSIHLWGEEYALVLKPELLLVRSRIVQNSEDMTISVVGPHLKIVQLTDLIEQWLRDIVREHGSKLIAKWEPLMNVKSTGLTIRRMKTRWGSCNVTSKNITLNTALAGFPYECIEYLVIHELAHLIEPGHNKRFYSVLDRYMPEWRNVELMLNGKVI